jgi:phospholipid/cholesterol/gamma-HCH transport system permease protein
MTEWQIERSVDRLGLAGELRISEATPIWRGLTAAVAQADTRLDIDLAEAKIVDGTIMALLVELRASLVARGIRSEIIGASDQLLPVVRLYRGDRPSLPSASQRREGVIERIGASVERMFDPLERVITFAGDLLSSAAVIVRRPSVVNWREVPRLIERAGTDGLPIVLLLNFLIGFVMAFQSMQQLKLYGANVYVADLVGISVTRELGPLITAIIITGRSGAAFAAELGTMRVSEEIDALRTMGITPVPHLVVPRVLALAIVAPILTLLGDVVGVIGGMVVAAVSLDVTPAGYLTELRTIVVPSDVWTGLLKSIAFGAAIALIGCQLGLTTRGSA